MKIQPEGQHNKRAYTLPGTLPPAPADCRELFGITTCEECPGPPDCLAGTDGKN